MATDTGFFRGMAAGALTTLAGFGLFRLLPPEARSLESVSPLPVLEPVVRWTYANLGLSVAVFALVLLLYVTSLRRLRRALGNGADLEAVAHAEQLVDVWTSVFFGVGVIWTAIGMRSALIYALGDDTTLAASDASSVLERLVNGGILVALSTTILGGIGGYVMRVVKVLSVGTALRRCYEDAARAPGERIEAVLHDIHSQLARLERQAAGAGVSPYVQAAVAERAGSPV